MQQVGLAGESSIVKREGEVACNSGAGGVEDHGKATIL